MRQVFVILSVLMLVIGGISAVALSADRSSTLSNQRYQNLPTATLLDTTDYEYVITEVNANNDPIVFDDQEIEGVLFSNFTYVSLYPSGLEFTATIVPPEDTELINVTLFYEFSGGSRGRAQAEPTGNENEWRAVPYDRGGLPPWQVMDVTFSVTLDNDAVAETEPVSVEYYDPTRLWFRAESEDAIVYWFDFPVELGDVVMQAVGAVQDKFVKGFGGKLSYVPRVVIFPPGSIWGEFRVGGQDNPRTTGSASSETQSAVLRVRGLEIEDIRSECIWNEPRDLDWQMRFAASVTTHEIAHLYQYDFFNGNGPAWWIEGQATFFELDSGPFDARMRNIALSEDLSTFQGQGPSGMVGTAASDGCTHLGYEQGTSFINWFVNNYGGYEAHREVVELMDSRVPLDEALTEVSGVEFIELERQWRTYVGLDPDPNIIPTPTFPLIPPSFQTATARANEVQ